VAKDITLGAISDIQPPVKVSKDGNDWDEVDGGGALPSKSAKVLLLYDTKCYSDVTPSVCC